MSEVPNIGHWTKHRSGQKHCSGSLTFISIIIFVHSSTILPISHSWICWHLDIMSFHNSFNFLRHIIALYDGEPKMSTKLFRATSPERQYRTDDVSLRLLNEDDFARFYPTWNLFSTCTQCHWVNQKCHSYQILIWFGYTILQPDISE